MNAILMKNSLVVFFFLFLSENSFTDNRAMPNFPSERTLQIRSTEGEPIGGGRALWMAGQFGRWIAIGADGRASVPAGPGVLIVKKGGYQCNGKLIGEKERFIEFVLYKDDQVGPVCITRPIPFNPKQQAELLEEVKERLWQQVESGRTPIPLRNDLLFLAQTDLDEYRNFVKQIDESKETGRIFEMLKAVTKGSLVSVLAKNNPKEVLELIEKEEDTIFKVSLLANLQRSLPENHEDQALVYKKIVQESLAIRPTLIGLGMLAGASSTASAFGQQELVRRVVKKEIEAIKNLGSTGRGGFIRSYFAGIVIDFDPKLADEFSKSKLGQSERIRARARFAFDCCRNHPGKSIQVMKELYDKSIGRSASERTQFANFSKVTHRLAGFHPKKVSALIEIQTDPVNRSWMWLMAAVATMNSRPTDATIFLKNCFKELENAKITSDSATSLSRIYMVSLPIAEKLMPGRVHGLVWRTYLSYIPKSRWITQHQDRFKNDRSVIATGLARYRKDLAEQLFGKMKLEEYRYGDPGEFRSVLILQPEDTSRFLGSVAKSRMNFRSFISPEDVHFFHRDRQKFWDRVSWLSFHDCRNKLFESF